MALITFVDEKDNVIGSGTKQDASKKGIIHRIVRIFLFNSKGEFLIQKRADHIASLPGLWDQSAGGHVDEGETYLEAAKREAEEEIGVQGLQLKELTKTYTDETDESGKIRKRFSTLFKTTYDGVIKSNPDEVSETKWITLEDLEKWMDDQPDDFTQGFLKSFKLFRKISS